MLLIDLVGQKFGRLVVVARAPAKGRVKWLCKCDCGKTSITAGIRLKNGMTRSCGCLNIEKIKQRRRLSEPWLVSRNRIIQSYKYRARKKLLSFSLSDDECESLFQSNCVYCGSPPTNIINAYMNKDRTSVRNDIQNPQTADYYFNGIDRIDNEIGYTLSNCVPCCKTCNYAKKNMSITAWNAWLQRMASYTDDLLMQELQPFEIPPRQMISYNKLLKSYKEAAARRNFRFQLTDAQCLTLFKSNCTYCGAPPSNAINPYIKKDGSLTKLGESCTLDPELSTFLYNGIDRTNPTIGYLQEKGQCVTCCKTCNEAKSDLSITEWTTYLERLKLHQRKINELLN